MYGKLFRSMYEGSLADNWKALVTFQQLVILSDSEGVVDMTPQAIHRITGIPLDIITEGLKELEKPDPASRTPTEDGKRIIKLDHHRPWGWYIVNHKYYKHLASREDKKRADRIRIAKKRALEKQSDSNNVASCRNQSSEVVNVAYTDTDTDLPFTNVKGEKKIPPLSKEEIENASLIKIEEHLDLVCKILKDQLIFSQAFEFKNKMLKEGRDARALLHTLYRCHFKSVFKNEQGGPWAYCKKILKIEEGNFREREHRKTSG